MKRKSVVIDILIKELEAQEKVILEYETELTRLPKGSIVKRKIGNQEYYYLSRRMGQKVVTEYVGRCSDTKVSVLESQIAQRRRLERVLRELKNEKKEIERMLR